MAVDTARVVREVIDLAPLLRRNIVRPVDTCTVSRMPQNQMAILSSLMENGSQTMAQLARQIIVCRQQMSQLTDELEKKGLVRRRASETDRRAVRVNLTEAGMAVVGEMEVEMLRALYPVFDGYTDEQKAILLDAAQAMRQVMHG